MSKNNLELNEDQKEAFEKLKEFVNTEKQHLCLLSGSAGVGKTFMVSYFVKWLLNKAMVHNVCLSSTTNKAVRVAMEMTDENIRKQLTFCTMHSLLGLKHEITKDGKEIFVRDKNISSKFPFFDFVIVDEASMLADQLFKEMEEQNFRGIKVLFVGDPNQINPVNHKMSIPMLEEKRKEHNIGEIKLTKIVRQAEGNPIIKVSQQVIHNKWDITPGYKEMVGDTGVVMISDTQTKVMAQLIQYYFGSSQFDDNADFCKIIAWRNKTVDYYNKYVRTFKYGAKANKIVQNEKLIVSRPIRSEDGKSSVFVTNEDLVVKQIEVKEKRFPDGSNWKIYDCCVQGFENVDNICILHESEEIRYSKVLKEMSTSASNEADVSKRIKKWRQFFEFKENFADVNYSYAITAHSSQGSTYSNAFVMYNDIMVNNREDERNRILYTALTRPKNMLYIV